MSEQGWQEFLGAEGVDDWVVLHGGATAVFRVRSVLEAARLAAEVAAVAGLEGSGALMTISDTNLTVRLSRDLWQLEPQHVELARSISLVARAHGAVADRMAVQEAQLAISAKPDSVDINFWRAVLGYSPIADDNAVDPLGHGSTVWMQELDESKPLRHAMHIDVSVARGHVEGGSLQRLPPEVGSSTTRKRRGAGSSLIAAATRSASLRGPTAPRLRLSPTLRSPNRGANYLAPGERLELSTNGLTVRCSAIELPRKGLSQLLLSGVDHRGFPTNRRRPSPTCWPQPSRSHTWESTGYRSLRIASTLKPSGDSLSTSFPGERVPPPASACLVVYAAAGGLSAAACCLNAAAGCLNARGLNTAARSGLDISRRRVIPTGAQQSYEE